MINKQNCVAGVLTVGLALVSGAAPGACDPYAVVAAPAEQNENNWMTFSVYRTGDTSGSATVQYNTVDVTAVRNVDYNPVSGTLTFYPNETMKQVRVWTRFDTLVEAPETFQLVLTGTGTQPPVTNGIGVIVSQGIGSPPVGVPTVPGGIPDVPDVPSVPKPPNPCPGSTCTY